MLTSPLDTSGAEDAAHMNRTAPVTFGQHSGLMKAPSDSGVTARVIRGWQEVGDRYAAGVCHGTRNVGDCPD